MKEKSGAALARAIGEYMEEVGVSGEPIVIRPFVLRQFVDVLACIDALREAGVVELKGAAGEVMQNFDPIKLILRGGDPALRILQIATAKPSEWINKLNMVDAAKVLSATFRVNFDFFTENQEALMEALGPIWTTVQELIQPTGPQPSKDSSPEDTPLPPSESTPSPS